MTNQRIFKSTVFFLIVALVIGSIAVVALAKNGGNNKINSGSCYQYGNQPQDCQEDSPLDTI